MAETQHSSHYVPPVWLNASFMEEALRSGEDDPSLTVTSIETQPAATIGEHYSSDIFRISVQFSRGGQQEQKKVILKTLHKFEGILELFDSSSSFEREAIVFKMVNPELYRLLHGVSSGMCQPFSAKCLYSSMGSPAPLIVVEDLKEQGFRMVDREHPLDMSHCLLVIRTLAQYHAASAVLNQKQPEIFKKNIFKTLYTEEVRTDLDVFFKSCLKNLANEVEKWPEYKDRFADKLHKLSETSYDQLMSITAQYDEDFNVLVHGDLWANNMMFRYAEGTGEVQDVRFLDYQLTRFGNPAQDILYFLYTSPSFSLLDKYDTLIEEYYKTLKQTLELFGLQNLCPSMEQLHKQIDKIGSFAVLVAGAVLAIVLVDRTNVPNMEKLMKTEESLGMSEKYKECIKKVLPLFEEKGWI